MSIIAASATLSAAEPVVRTSSAEAVVFWVVGTLTAVSALGVLISSRAVYSAIFLASTMINLAVLYVAQDAMFLGVVQVVVYTGAVMMLFLFVIMLIGVDNSESLTETICGQRVTVIVAGLGFGVLLTAAVSKANVGQLSGLAEVNSGGNVPGLAALIFTRYLWAFELTSALLITAALGAMVLAHRERLVRRKSQRELAEERFLPGGHATPMPAPGVYARHNSVDLPTLLADGTYSDLAVRRTRERHGLVLTLLVDNGADADRIVRPEEGVR